MKVAIIGGGLSGLSCAHELEKHNIRPVVYERQHYIGAPYPLVTAAIQIWHRPVKDVIEYYRNAFGISINPLNTVKKLVHCSPNRENVIRGSNLGYLLKRGRDRDSLNNQVYSQLKKTEIRLNEIGDYRMLSRQYDVVVIATGNPVLTEELGCWQTWLDAYVRGAVVLGDFDPNTAVIWFNKSYCKNGYAYLLPFDSKKAALHLVVTNVDERDIDRYWEMFLYSENLKYTMVEEFEQRHTSGFAYPLKLGNLYFVGNACGGLDPFLGFGHLNAIVTGVMAARSVAGGKDYEKLLKGILKNLRWRLEFRKLFNTLDDRDYDRLITAIGLPGIRHLLYHTNFNVFKYGSLAIRLLSGDNKLT